MPSIFLVGSLFVRAVIATAGMILLAAPLLAGTVTTGTVSNVYDTSATLSGTVNTGSLGIAHFQWGTTTNYTQSAEQLGYVMGYSDVVRMNVGGLQPSTTYHFRLACEVLGGSWVYGEDQTFTTNPATIAPTVEAVSASPTAAGAALSVAVSAGNLETSVLFEYGLTAGYGSQQGSYSPVLAARWETQEVSGTLSGLQPGTTYHCRCRAVNSLGTAYGPDVTFRTNDAPVITAGLPSSITDLSSVLNGTVDAKGGEYYIWAQYGLTTAYGKYSYGASVNGQGNAGVGPVPCSVLLSSLLPSTTYHYRLVAVDKYNVAYFGTDQTFTTAAGSTPPEVDGTVATPSLSTPTSVQLSVRYLYTGSSATTVSYEYGPTTSYGSTATFSTLYTANLRIDGTFATVNLSGLTPGITYHFRGRATNGQGTDYTEDSTFTTVSGAVPTTGATTAVTDLAARLNGTVNTNWMTVRVVFEYGLTTAYGSTLTMDSYRQDAREIPLSAQLQGLLPDTTYHYRIRATDYYNSANVYYGQDVAFTTAPAATKPVAGAVYASNVKAESAQLSCISVAAGSSTTTVVFEYGRTLAYGSSVAYELPLAVNAIASPVVQLTNLEPSTLYHVRAVATNAQGSHATADATFTTPASGRPKILGAISTTQVRVSAVAVQALDVYAGNDLATVVWDYGLATDYGTTIGADTRYSQPSRVPAGTVRTVTGVLTGLKPGTTYHYRCRAINSEGTAVSTDGTFTTSTGPVLVTQPATEVMDVRATLRGSATASAGALQSIVFQMGATTAYNSEVAAAQGSLSAGVSSGISGFPLTLEANTTYHYRLRAMDEDNNWFYGEDQSFTTGPPVTPPAVTPLSPSVTTGLSATGATLVVNVLTRSSPTTVVFEHGPTTVYGKQAAYSTVLPPHENLTISVNVTGLTPGTPYHFRAIATNNEGSSPSVDSMFTLPPLPEVTTGATANLRPASVSLGGAYRMNGGGYEVFFDFGETTGSEAKATSDVLGESAAGATEAPPAPLPVTAQAVSGGSITIGVGGGGWGGGGPQTVWGTAVVQPAKTYRYRLRLTDPYGNSYFGSDATFTTPAALDFWRQQNFGSTVNAGAAADTACPANDGIPNLMKYALGMNPARPGTQPPVGMRQHQGERYLSISFPRNPDALDVIYEVEAADSPLGPWSLVATIPPAGSGTGPGFVAENVVYGQSTAGSSPPIIGSTIEVRDTVSLGTANQRFMRLRVRR